jgi:UDP-3-O-[3-hydroxymyristoyl] glucosamine N-acyltransferase
MSLHNITLIHPKAQIAPNVTFDTYTEISREGIIEEDVIIGDRCKFGCKDIATDRLRISQSLLYNTFLIKKKECTIKKGNIIHDGAFLFQKVPIGEGCSIGNNSFITSNSEIRPGVVIGYSTCVGPFVRIGDNSHILNLSVIGSASSMVKSAFASPSVLLADNKYVLRTFRGSRGPIIEDYVRTGALSVITYRVE